MNQVLHEIVLGIILDKERKLLIVQRKKKEKSKEGMVLSWGFPGGEVEEGESLKESVVREVFEESNCKVVVIEAISERVHPQFPVHITYFACDLLKKSKSLVVDEDILCTKWIDPDNLLNYLTTDLDSGVAEYLKLR